MIETIISQIKAHERIIIHRHVRPDPDAYGSQAGLGKILTEMYPDKDIIIAGEAEQKLAYLATPTQPTQADYKGALVIVCDTANWERIDGDYMSDGDYLIKIDHHPNLEPYGDLQWVDTETSSTSEMIFELYEVLKNETDYEISKEAARLIYAGIVGDTGHFIFKSTSARTFGIAKSLIETGFDRQALYANMFQSPLSIAKFKGQLLTDLEPTPHGSASFKITKEMLNSYGVSMEDTHAFVGIAGDIKDVLAWVFFVEDGDEIRVRLRSKGPVINELARKYNGGGHPMASGATIYSWDEVKPLVNDLDQICKAYKEKHVKQ